MVQTEESYIAAQTIFHLPHLNHLKNLPLSKPASPRKRKQDITHKANLLNLTHFEISNLDITKSLV